MNARLQGNLAILAGYLVLFAATVDGRLAALVTFLVLLALSLYKVRQNRG